MIGQGDEKWVPMKEEGLEHYFISNKGKVFNSINQRIVALHTNKSTGYVQASLWNRKQKKPAKRYVHRLVAITFIPNPDNNSEVDHIDSNKQNNCFSNLRWVTRKGNLSNKLCRKHMSENHADVTGEKNPFYGKKHTEESKKKMGKAMYGVNNPNFGRTGEKHPMFGKPSPTKGKLRYFNEETGRYYYR